MAQVQIKNKERVRFYNMQAEFGTLDRARETRIIRYELIDKLSEEQLESRGIHKNIWGIYECSEDTAEISTNMTLTDESLEVFKAFIQRASEEGKVFYLDEPLFRQIISITEDK